MSAATTTSARSSASTNGATASPAGPFGRGVAVLTASGQQYQAAHAGAPRELREAADPPGGLGHAQVGCVGQVGRAHAVQGGRPGVRVVPVEPGARRPGPDPDRAPEGREPCRHPAAGRSGSSHHEGGLCTVGRRPVPARLACGTRHERSCIHVGHLVASSAGWIPDLPIPVGLSRPRHWDEPAAAAARQPGSALS
jgi:hypothetical protein